MHAGLEEGRLNLVVFEDSTTLKSILESLDVEVQDSGRILVDGQQPKCACCGKDITLSNLGNLMPGSLEFFCDGSTCLADYVVRHRGY